MWILYSTRLMPVATALERLQFAGLSLNILLLVVLSWCAGCRRLPRGASAARAHFAGRAGV